MIKRTKKGFTLIELLVVISIIAMLLAILMPSLQKAKKIAQSVVCKSNLKQWGLIWNLYGADNENEFTPQNKPWIDFLEPYFQEGDIRLCASTPKKETIPDYKSVVQYTHWGPYSHDAGYVNPYVKEGEYGSYAINGWILKLPQSPNPNNTFWYGSIVRGKENRYWQKNTQKNADNIPVMGDGWWSIAHPDDSDRAYEQHPVYQSFGDYPEECGRMFVVSINRHSGKINMLFMDWSARDVKLKELWQIKWHGEFATERDINRGNWPEWIEKLN